MQTTKNMQGGIIFKLKQTKNDHALKKKSLKHKTAVILWKSFFGVFKSFSFYKKKITKAKLQFKCNEHSPPSYKNLQVELRNWKKNFAIILLMRILLIVE